MNTATPLTDKQRLYLAQAWEILEDYAEGNRTVGNDSIAAGAMASAHVIKEMLAPTPYRDATGAPPPGFIKPDTAEHVYFYEQDFYVLSNFSSFQLVHEGLDFPTSEHAYHWEKFATEEADFTRNDVAFQISAAPSAHEAFKIAEANKHLRRPDWDQVKVDVMRVILRAKAAQHEYVRRKLLATGDRELVEDSWRDDFWGWGPNRDGRNMLGQLWMEVRSELRAAQQEGGARHG